MVARPQHDTHHRLFDTAFGVCGVAWTARGLKALQLPERDGVTTERRLAAKAGSTAATAPPPWVETLIADIRRFLAGERVEFSAVRVDLDQVEPFRRNIYAALRDVGFGRTTTYGELARRAGASEWQAAREVGDAMARNPAPLVIPCHRVLAADGKIGGFSAQGGSATKRRLLALEGVRLDGSEPRLPGL
jgi:methylated-DNA-[protein]-cysteine S-methyltransferase